MASIRWRFKSINKEIYFSNISLGLIEKKDQKGGDFTFLLRVKSIVVVNPAKRVHSRWILITEISHVIFVLQ